MKNLFEELFKMSFKRFLTYIIVCVALAAGVYLAVQYMTTKDEEKAYLNYIKEIGCEDDPAAANRYPVLLGSSVTECRANYTSKTRRVTIHFEIRLNEFLNNSCSIETQNFECIGRFASSRGNVSLCESKLACCIANLTTENDRGHHETITKVSNNLADKLLDAIKNIPKFITEWIPSRLASAMNHPSLRNMNYSARATVIVLIMGALVGILLIVICKMIKSLCCCCGSKN